MIVHVHELARVDHRTLPLGSTFRVTGFGSRVSETNWRGSNTVRPVKLLTFQAKRFAWTPFSKTLDDAPDAEGGESISDCVVAFIHVEPDDVSEERRSKVFKTALKHLKWLANKREYRSIVLHTFAHLGGENADPEESRALFDSLAERLRQTGYEVWITPFGYFCEWDLSVHGESLAKVWKSI